MTDKIRSSEAMRQDKLHGMTSAQLVERFTAIALEQDEALLMDEIETFNRLFDQMEAVENELKSRAGDQRQLLLALYGHPNMQVRLVAAKATLAVVPDAARQMLKAIADSGWFPQAGDAGMSLDSLDRGIFKPS